MQDASFTRMSESIDIEVIEESQIAQARRTAAHLAEQIGFDSVSLCHITTSVSELASNLVFHATCGGRLIFTPLRRFDQSGFQIESVDEGPGIADIEQALTDGFSTNGGLGGGLPGVRRLMDEFEISSTPGAGTTVIARKWKPCT